MHPALATPELVELVCEKDPALDALWSTQRGIQNIIKCLPSQLWEVRGVCTNTAPGVLHIVGPVQPADWTVPLSYARRIKTLYVKDPLVKMPDATVFKTITSTLPSQFLCPNLRTLHWGMDHNDHLPYIHLFLSPRIQFVNLDILTPNLETPIQSGLALQSLKRLHVHCACSLVSAVRNPPPCRQACDLIKQLDQIESLWVPNVNREALERLARLPSLKVLNLEYARTALLAPAAGGGAPLSPSFPPFAVPPTVASPTLGPYFWATYRKEMCQPYAPRSTVDCRPPPSPTCRYPRRAPGHDPHINDLLPLLSFRNLIQAHLNLPVVTLIDDAMAMDIATSWPKLTELVLAQPRPGLFDPPSQLPPRMTLKALLAFATYCRDLESLTLYIDAAAAIPSPSDGEFPERQSALRVLNVEMSPIGSEFESVGKFLGRLFPHLGKIRTNHNVRLGFDQSPEGVTTEDRWNTVQRLLGEGRELSHQ
ncbi:hypothetical protein FB45DRAFT_1052356 [Roridomyces roridus]|uniref:F-box domain-containing protein n=1 Tax=Roridomyces roridus TaxID=1738132 RepID=A0AAD7CGD2_9AGAR|nr:hypothetical protein FB45DRAFT_1052356 [Roridomyces roridus]